MTDFPDRPAGGVRSWLARQGQVYRHGEDRPLSGYVVLMSIYGAGTALAATWARVGGQSAPKNVSPWEAAQLTMATYTVSRLIAKDPVTSPLRAPFTTFQGTSAPSELAEEVRGHGLQHSVGELLTCPMCLGQWIATALTFGLILAPTPTRLAMATFSAVGGANFLHHAYVRLQQAGE